MRVPFNRLDLLHAPLQEEILHAVSQVIRSGMFILGEELQRFEERFADFHGRKHAIGVNSGTDALILPLKALDIGPGDEVITTSHSFITTVSSIALVGAKPVLIDIGEDDNIDPDLIEQAITSHTKAILPVHWMGRPSHIERICEIAKKYNLKIVEDCAQAIAATFDGKLVGTFGECGGFSLHPFKTLGACGDAGIIITDDDAIAERVRLLRHNGLSMQGICHEWSNNSRLDAMQAAILQVKFNHFEKWTQRRIEIAQHYDKHLSGIEGFELPKPNDARYYSVYHTYIAKAQNREELRQYLYDQGIETRVHYGRPIHKQPVMQETFVLPKLEKAAEEIVSLPIYPDLTLEQQDHVIERVKLFYTKKKSEMLCESPIHT